MSMHNRAAILDDILIRWIQHRPGSVGRGFNDRSPGAGDLYRPSRQYDDQNGALDEDIEHERMKVVDFQIWQMAEQHRWALTDHARGLMLGLDVWRNPRLPQDKTARDELISQARGRLAERLLIVGVM